MQHDRSSPRNQPWKQSDSNDLASNNDHDHYLFSTKTVIAMALLLGTAIGFGICTAQSHAGSGSPPDAQSPTASPASFTGPVYYVPAPAVPGTSQPPQAQILPAGAQMIPSPAQVAPLPGGQIAASASQSAAPVDMSTASGDFVNSQGIVYERTYVPGPEYPMNPNWTVSRNGLIGNPAVDPTSCQGRAYSMPLN
jgi:hypothetical protein